MLEIITEAKVGISFHDGTGIERDAEPLADMFNFLMDMPNLDEFDLGIKLGADMWEATWQLFEDEIGAQLDFSDFIADIPDLYECFDAWTVVELVVESWCLNSSAFKRERRLWDMMNEDIHPVHIFGSQLVGGEPYCWCGLDIDFDAPFPAFQDL